MLTVVHRESLHKKRSEARASAATEGMEDEESLEPGALVRQLPHPVQHQVDDLLADGVVAPSVVVGGVLLAGDQLLGVEQLAVRAKPHLVHHRWLQVHKDGSWNVLSRPWEIRQLLKLVSGNSPVSEKKVLKESSPQPADLSEGIVPSGWMPVGEGSGTLVTENHRDQFDATRKPSCTTVLQTIKFPASISNLATGLAHVDADALSLRRNVVKIRGPW